MPSAICGIAPNAHAATVIFIAKQLPLALFLLLTFFGILSASQSFSACGALNSANTVYVLSANITNLSAGVCILVNNTNITVDCNGKNISISTTDGGYVITSSSNGTTVRNCPLLFGGGGGGSASIAISGNNSAIYNIRNISNTSGGIRVTGSNIMIENVSVTNFEDEAMMLDGCANCSIKNYSVTAVESGSHECLNFQNSNYSGVSNSFFANCYRSSVLVTESSTGIIIENNTMNKTSLCNDGIGGITLKDNAYNITIRNNSIRSNCTDDSGIEVYNQAANATMTGNSISVINGVGLNLWGANSNITAYRNNITAKIWVNNSNATNTFNISGQGNAYSLANGTPSWLIFNISDTNGDYYADTGPSLPFNSTTVGGNWTGIGGDWHPYVKLLAASGSINSTLSAGAPLLYVNDTMRGFCKGTSSSASTISYSWKWFQNGALFSNGTTGAYSNGAWVNVANVTGLTTSNWTLECRANDSINFPDYANITASLAPPSSLTTDGQVYTLNENITFSTINSIYNSAFYMAGNTVLDCTGYSLNGPGNYTAIYMDGTNITAKNCKIRNFTTGIDSFESETVRIFNDTISNSTNGIYSVGGGSDDIAIENNTINASGYALSLDYPAGISIKGNSLISQASSGIHMLSGDTCNATNNTITAQTGIFLEDTSNCKVRNNSITASVWINNTGTGNTFNNSTAGNAYYFTNGIGSWNSFSAIDNNSDGYADIGTSLPFNSTTVGGNWSGPGSDWHPYTAVSASAPAIMQVTPSNNSILTTPNATFSWNATDLISNNVTCNLTIDGTINRSGIPVTNAALYSTNPTSNLSIGSHNWSVSCWNGFNLSNSSSTLPFTLSYSVIGNSSSLNTTAIARPNVTIGGNPAANNSTYGSVLAVIIADGSSPLVSFSFDFNNSIRLNINAINLSNGTLSGASYISISGVNSTGGQSGTKTAYLYNASGSFDGICIKDAEGALVSDISSTCTGPGEFSVKCDGSASSGYSCTHSGTSLTLTGLQHSAAIQFSIPVPTPTSGGTSYTGGGTPAIRRPAVPPSASEPNNTNNGTVPAPAIPHQNGTANGSSPQPPSAIKQNATPSQRPGNGIPLPQIPAPTAPETAIIGGATLVALAIALAVMASVAYVIIRKKKKSP